jgi:hypothetical protein
VGCVRRAPGDLWLVVFVGERPERRDGLRDGHLEVDALDCVLAGRAAELVAADRVAALEQGLQLAVLKLAGQAEIGGSSAGPGAGRLALAGVVILGALGDLLGVVVGGAPVASPASSDLADGEHRRGRRNLGASV